MFVNELSSIYSDEDHDLHPTPTKIMIFIDQMIFILLLAGVVDGASDLVFGHPFLGELTSLDVAENTLHDLPRLVCDYSLAARQVSELGGVGNGRTHVGDTALVDQVDDQFYFV